MLLKAVFNSYMLAGFCSAADGKIRSAVVEASYIIYILFSKLYLFTINTVKSKNGPFYI